MSAPSPPSSETGLTRRRLLQGAGVLGGLAVARGLGAGAWLAGSGEDTTAGHLRALTATLTPRQRELIVLPADHPSRQIINTISVLDRPHLGTLLSPAQQVIAERLTASLLSPSGCRDLAGTFAVEGRFEGCVLAVYGEPESGDAHVVLEGGHVMLRGGGASGSSPFGGGMAYGHQIGNGLWRVPGNSFAYHGDAANRLMHALDAGQRAAAIQSERPHELVLQPRGAGEAIPGVRLGALPDAAREAGQSLVDAVLSMHPDPVRAEARSALEANGGLDALRFATFADKGFYPDMTAWSEHDARERERRGTPYWQVWRLEGPGAVFHFQGHPHVHAYVHIVRDPDQALFGETLGVIDRPIEGPAMARLLDRALAHATGESLAWHGEEVPGRFCAGPVTTGLAFALDPYANPVVVVTLSGRDLAEPLRRELTGRGVAVEDGREYRVATIGYVARQPALVGEVRELEETGLFVRDALIGWLRSGGLERG